MATVNVMKNKRTQSRAGLAFILSYCKRESKTVHEGRKLVSGVNCLPESAYQEFMNTKLQYGKTDGRMFYHFTQSFSPTEDITPETAHEIAVKLAEKMFPGFEVLVATHTDKAHTHSHFVVNSVSCENGYKYHSDNENIERLRAESDKLCLQYGLSVLSPKEQSQKVKQMSSREYRAAERGESWKMQLIVTIEDAMAIARSREHFIRLMEAEGYEVKWTRDRKSITYTMPDGKRCRDNKLHEEKFLKENMEYEFEIRQEILAGRDDRDARDRSDRRNTHGEDQRRGMGEPCEDGRGYAGSYTIYDDGEKEHVHYESFVFDENGNPIEESGGAYERANRESDEDHHGRERKTGWESERESYFSGRKMGEAPKHTVVGANPVRGRSVGSRLALGGLVGLASLTDDDNENKTAEEIEAEERARLAGQNVVAVLELVKLGVELATQHSDSADEPVEEPTLKM